MQELESLIESATKNFKKLRKYFSKKDIDTYTRLKILNKTDIAFLEEVCLIHIKNIEKGDKIKQNFYRVLDNFVFNSLLQKQFFTSFELFRIFCYRISLLPKSLFLWEAKRHTRHLLNHDANKIKFRKEKNALKYIAPLPLSTADSEKYIQECLNLLLKPKLDSLIINPLNLVPKAKTISKDEVEKSLTQNLSTLLNNSNAKAIYLDNTDEFFDQILESAKKCIESIPYLVTLGICVKSYHLDSISSLEKIATLSKSLLEKKKAKLVLRICDIDFDYQLATFKNDGIHKSSNLFANHANSVANFMALLEKYKGYKDVLECSILTSNIFLLEIVSALGLESNLSLEIDSAANSFLFKYAKYKGISSIAMQYYTTHWTQMLAYRLKGFQHDFSNGTHLLISLQTNKAEWKKRCNDFSHSFKTSKKIMENNDLFSIKDNSKDTDDINDLSKKIDSKILNLQQCHFETFDHEKQKPFDISNIESLSFDRKLNSLQYGSINRNKLEDMLYLNREDLLRVTMEHLSNMPAMFSLNAQKEKDALDNAKRKKDEVEKNKIHIMTIILSHLRKEKAALFATLCKVYPNIPTDILQEQVYLLIDTFKYYAYEYKRLQEETDSVLLSQLGNILIHAKSLNINEIGAILAANIMIGNVSYLQDCMQTRILYYLFMPIFDFCPFMAIYEDGVIRDIHKHIITHNDMDSYKDSNNLLVSHKGILVVFISSFYDLYEAYCEIILSNMAYKVPVQIYVDEYIYNEAKQVFVPLNVECKSLGNLVHNLPSDVSHVSIFTYNKVEMNYALNNIKVSLTINAAYKLQVLRGSTRSFKGGYLEPFLSRFLLHNLLAANPNSVIKKNSLYSDVIGCFGDILSVEEIEFLYNLNHNYSQYLKNLDRVIDSNNIYEVKKHYEMLLCVYDEDDFFHVSVIMLVAFLLQIPTTLHIYESYFIESTITKEHIEKLKKLLKEKHISVFDIVIDNATRLREVHENTLVRILQDEEKFSREHESDYKILRERKIIAEYSLPILNKNLELERYLYAQYVHIKPNIFLETQISHKVV